MNNLHPENDWRDYLEHSARGQKWARHKYIAIENGRYIYPKEEYTKGPVQPNYVIEDPGKVKNRPRGHGRKIDYDNLWSVEKGNALNRKKRVGNNNLFSGKGSGNHKTSIDMVRIAKLSVDDLKINGKKSNNHKVVRSGGSTTRSGNSSLVKPKNLKAKPGGTSAVDEIKGVGSSSAHGLHGHKRKAKFSKNSKSKTWTAENAVVKKRNKASFRKRIGNILGR